MQAFNENDKYMSKESKLICLMDFEEYFLLIVGSYKGSLKLISSYDRMEETASVSHFTIQARTHRVGFFKSNLAQ